MILSVKLEKLAPEDELSLEAAKDAEDFFWGVLSGAGPLQSGPKKPVISRGP